MTRNLSGFRVLGIVAFGVLSISLVSACNGNGSFTVSDASSTVATGAANPGQQPGGGTGSTGTGGPTTANPGPPTANPAGQGAVAPHPAATSVARCGTQDLSAHLGAVTWYPDASSDHATGKVPVIYTNVSGRTCTMDGFSGVDLHGPASDPNGPVFSLARANDPAHQPKPFTLQPGAQANTTVTFTTWHQGEIGAMGSTNWVPTTLVVTPPNQTASFTLPWFQGVSVLRDDTATHRATYVYPVSPGANAIQ